MDLSSVCSSWSRGPDDILTMFNTSWNSPTLQAPNVHLCPAGLFHVLLFLALYFWDYPQIWRQANRLSQRKACFVFNQAISNCSSQLTGRYIILYIIRAELLLPHFNSDPADFSDTRAPPRLPTTNVVSSPLKVSNSIIHFKGFSHAYCTHFHSSKLHPCAQ